VLAAEAEERAGIRSAPQKSQTHEIEQSVVTSSS
jgi:hypothetical protein